MCTLLGEMGLVRNVGHRCQANTENDLAKQLNSETVKKWNHNKWWKQLSIGVLGWETTRLNPQGLRHEMPFFFRYILHEGSYLRSVEW